jgi:glycosyltransferase involved in cell wall biosynthesis
VEFLKIDKKKVRVVYHGVDDHFRPDVPTESILEVKNKYRILTSKYILWVGTLEPRKNLPTLIEAYRELKSIHSEYTLVLGGGPGWQYQDILNLTLSLGSRIQSTGYLPQGDLIPLYAGASLFVYPSLYEGFGMPLLEAMASGVPIVASRTSSIPEVVGDAGVLVDPLSISDISEAILKLLNNSSLRSSFREKGIQRAKQFTWERAAQETLRVYQEIIGRE